MLVAVSSCLLGNQVRYDATSKRNDLILSELSEQCEFIPVCPEHIAFGIPRPTIRVEVESEEITRFKTVVNETGVDVTSELELAIEEEINKLKLLPITGIILKARSPSCGVGSCPINREGTVVDTGNGLLANACIEAFPELPIVDEEQLLDDATRAEFIKQVTRNE